MGKATAIIATADALLVGFLFYSVGFPLWVGALPVGIAAPATALILKFVDEMTKSDTDPDRGLYAIDGCAKGFNVIYKKIPVKVFRAITGRKTK